MYKDFDKIIDLCKEFNLKLNLTTNGSFLGRGAANWSNVIVPVLPTPEKLDNGDINTNLETNGQLITYLPIIVLLGSPTLTSRILKKNSNPVDILKGLPKIILNYLVPTSIDALYFIDPYLLKLYNDAELINHIPLTKINPVPDKLDKNIIDENYNPKLNKSTKLEIQKLTTEQILSTSHAQVASILLDLSQSQLISLNIIPLTPNINNIINNDNISAVDFSNYNSNELLFLSETQVESLTIPQLKTIELIFIL